MLSACSSNENKTAQTRLICPQTTECRNINPQVKTNGLMVQSLNEALNKLDVCVIAYEAVTQCITDFNNQK
ncbi:Rz1-like lysis system protein LysC [Actinobacillus porcitonsillarum]|uniref:Rz1-like lysis system protein LysC n=1 Tax=Actinobacillus porcitonsillarum TaxID=189834 RepID=UPI003B837738